MSTPIIAPSASLSSHSNTYGPTAGQRVYSIPHIRRQIIRNMTPLSLANLLRTEKACFEEVVRELYYAVPVKVVEDHMSNDPLRRPIYLKAIVEVDAYRMAFSRKMRCTPGWEHFTRDSIIDKYDPVTFNFVVPYLRFALPSLQKIRFKVGDYDEIPGLYSWLVTFSHVPDGRISPDQEPVYDQRGYTGSLSGSIDFLENRYEYIGGWQPGNSALSSGFTGPRPPKGSYTTRYRFNLRLCHQLWDPVNLNGTRDWSRAFQDAPGLENIHTRLDVEDYPITVDDITSLCRRQISAGHTVRLQKVSADMLAPWQVSSFATLASVASTSLTCLDMIGKKGCPRPLITFDDIPALTMIIRDNLPNLTSLALRVDGIAGAEATCGQLLSPQSLDAGGTLKSLTIGAWRAEGEGVDAEIEDDRNAALPFFNSIRVLSGLCAFDATIRVGGGHEKIQSKYLQYLRRQPHHCRLHLATVDFRALGLAGLSQVLGLNYDRDGRPVFGPPRMQSSWEKTKTAQWASAIASYHDGFKSKDLLDTLVMTIGMSSCHRISAHLDKISPTGAVWEREAAAKQLLESMLIVEAEADRAKASLDVEGVRAYIKSLEHETQAGEGTSGV